MRNEQEIAVIEKMTSILTKILDATEKENITDENAKIALTDIFKLLNMSVDAFHLLKLMIIYLEFMLWLYLKNLEMEIC